MLANYQTTNLMTGLFLRKLNVDDFQQFAESLPWRLPEFDGEAVLNPQQGNVAPDVPRVRFQSKDGRLFLEVAPAKIHFRMMPGEVKKTEQGTNVQALPIDKAFDNFIPQVTRLYTTLQEHYDAVASRVGVVADMIAPTPSSANQRLQKVLMNDSTLLGDRLNEVSMNVLARTSLDGGTNVNRRVALRSLRSGGEGNPDNILNVNIDINTLADEQYDIDTDSLASFLSNTSKHIQENIPFLKEESVFS